MAVHLQYLLITVKLIALEKVSFSDTQNPKAVNTLDVNDKQYLFNRDNLSLQIHLQLCQK